MRLSDFIHGPSIVAELQATDRNGVIREMVQKHKVIATPAQMRTLIEEQAQSYEAPEEVQQWYYQNSERMQEIESLALEENVVAWVMEHTQVEDTPSSFEELMGRP